MYEVVVGVEKVRQIENALTQSGFGWFQYKILFFLCGIAQLGSYSAYTAGLIAGPQMGVVVWPEWIMKYIFSWLAGIFIDKFGRIFSLYSALVLASVTLIAACFAGVEMYLVLRTFGCMSIGAIQVINYVIVAEVCPKKQRSRCLFFLVIMDCVGTLFGSATMMLPIQGGPPFRMRMLFAVIPLPVALLAAVVVLRGVDSPFYLVVSGKPEAALRLLERIAIENKNANIFRRNVNQAEFLRSLTTARAAISVQDRGTLAQVSRIPKMSLIMGVWAIQAIIYWGAMSAIPSLYRVWSQEAPSTSTTYNLEILLLLYAFEFIGIGVAAFSSFKWGPYKTLFYFIVIGSVLLAISTLSLGLKLGWFLAACVGGLFASLTPIWGILFVITSEIFPTHCRATALGLMLSTRVAQGVLELALPKVALEQHVTFLPMVYSSISTAFSIGGILIAKRLIPKANTTRIRTWSNSVVITSPKVVTEEQESA